MASLKEILESKLSDPEKERHNETLRRIGAAEVMATLAEHLNNEREDFFSKVVSRIWGWSSVQLKNVRVIPKYFPEVEFPYVALTAKFSEEFKSSEWKNSPDVGAGEQMDIYWLETGRENPERLTFVMKRAWIVSTKRYGLLFKDGRVRFYELGQIGSPEELLGRILDSILNWERFEDRETVYGEFSELKKDHRR